MSWKNVIRIAGVGKCDIEATYLAVIEGTMHSEIVHVWVSDRGHLRLLDRRNAALRVQNENRHIRFIAKAINGGTSSSCQSTDFA